MEIEQTHFNHKNGKRIADSEIEVNFFELKSHDLD